MAEVKDEDQEITALNQTVNPSIIWKLTPEAHEYILHHLDNALLPYLDESARFAFVFHELPEEIFNTIYDITVEQQFPYHIMRGHERFATLN